MKNSILFLFLFSVLLTTPVFAEQNNPQWGTLEKIIGTWRGEYDGHLGKGGGVIVASYDLNNAIILLKGRYEYPVTEKRPALTHNNLMVIYQNADKKINKAMYFDDDGQAIQFTATQTDSTIIFNSDKSAASPFYKIVYTYIDKNTLDIKMEKSKDGITFSTYMQSKSQRRK